MKIKLKLKNKYVHDECEPWSRFDHGLHINVAQFMSQIPQNGKNCKSCEQRGERVHETYDQGVSAIEN